MDPYSVFPKVTPDIRRAVDSAIPSGETLEFVLPNVSIYSWVMGSLGGELMKMGVAKVFGKESQPDPRYDTWGIVAFTTGSIIVIDYQFHLCDVQPYRNLNRRSDGRFDLRDASGWIQFGHRNDPPTADDITRWNAYKEVIDRHLAIKEERRYEFMADDPNLVGLCTVIGGYGFDEVTNGLQYQVGFAGNELIFVNSGRDWSFATSIPIERIQSMAFGGPGLVTTPGNFVAYGTNAKQAMESGVIAAVGNFLTTRQSVQTLVRIDFINKQGEGALIYLENITRTPNECEINLAQLLAIIRNNAEREVAPQPEIATAPAGRDIVEQLAQLNELHKSGALTDEEFQHAKRTVLGN